MAKNLAKNFINLSDRGFSSNRSPELGLNHGEGGLHIRPLVIMSQESIPIEVVEVPHAIPETVKLMMIVSHASRIDLEGDISRATLRLNGMEISPVGVGFVSRDFIDVECLSCLCLPEREVGEYQPIHREWLQHW